MIYFDMGVYVFLAIVVGILIVAAVVFYKGNSNSTASDETEGNTPILIPLLAIATSGLALVFVKYLFDTL